MHKLEGLKKIVHVDEIMHNCKSQHGRPQQTKIMRYAVVSLNK